MHGVGRWCRVALAAAFVTAASSARALPPALAACEKIADGDRRLACILASPSDLLPDSRAKAISLWQEFDHTDAITGERRVGASLPAKRTLIQPQRREAISNKTGFLQISCSGRAPIVWFFVEGELVADHSARVSYRFDERPPVVRAGWQRSTDSTAVGPGRGNALRLVREIETSKSLVWRVENNVFGTTEMEFDLGGAANALKAFKARCGK